MNRAEKILKKEGINTIDDAFNFMDKVISKLSDKKLEKLYYGIQNKDLKKPTEARKEMVEHIYKKCIERGIEL